MWIRRDGRIEHLGYHQSWLNHKKSTRLLSMLILIFSDY
jgi:hypothetical protein